MHESYEKKFRHKADFKVRYTFRSAEEGGRKSLPFQGAKLDFSYEDSEEKQYMIWPEFLDIKGKIITDTTLPVPKEGTALMWIYFPEKRSFHSKTIKIGTRGFLREGSLYVADIEVIEILNLLQNPSSKKFPSKKSYCKKKFTYVKFSFNALSLPQGASMPVAIIHKKHCWIFVIMKSGV